MANILAINGSYREDGITDQALATLIKQLESEDAHVEQVILRDYPIEFCLNCRECAQEPGTTPGKCVIDDGMEALVKKIEVADGYILASPTNYGSVTALFKRFIERLTVYGYYPWGAIAPKYRKAKLPQKRALVVSSSAAPAIMGKWLFDTTKQLEQTAKIIGAKSVGVLFTGTACMEKHKQLPENIVEDAEKLAHKLITP